MMVLIAGADATRSSPLLPTRLLLPALHKASKTAQPLCIYFEDGNSNVCQKFYNFQLSTRLVPESRSLSTPTVIIKK
jgi:hypothetical protein